METKQKKHYLSPRMEETLLAPASLLALSGGEQTEMGVFPGMEKDAGNALANPFNPFRGFGF